MLLACSCARDDDDLFAEALLEHGPVYHREAGFVWSSEPVFCGLASWAGVVELADDGDFYFSGSWGMPTKHDLYSMANLSIAQLEFGNGHHS